MKQNENLEDLENQVLGIHVMAHRVQTLQSWQYLIHHFGDKRTLACLSHMNGLL